MKIVIDDKPDLVSADEGSVFGKILEQLREWLDTHRLVITDLQLDGEILTPQRRVELERVPVDAFDTLEVSTIDPHALSKQTLLEVKSHLPPLSKSLVEVTENIQQGDLPGAWIKLTLCFDVWSVIAEAIDKVSKLMNLDLASFTVEGQSLETQMAALRDLLEKAKNAMENQDIVTVGDLMEYEFSPRVESWSQIIDALHTRIDEQGPK